MDTTDLTKKDSLGGTLQQTKPGGLQPNQINDIFNQQLNRDATPHEVVTHQNSPIQTLANLKDTHAKLNPNSIVDYLTSVGQDSSMANRQKLGQQYGITNVGTAEGNMALLNAIKSGKPVTPPTVPGAISTNTTNTTNTDNTINTTDTTNTVGGTVAAAATPQAPVDDPIATAKTSVDTAYATQQSAQQAVNDIDKQLAALKQSKMDEIARSGGVVNEASLTSELLRENEPLLARRKELANEYTKANQDYQKAKGDYTNAQNQAAKQANLDLAKEKQASQESQFATKTGIQQEQFDTKTAIQQKQFEDKLIQSGYKKVNDYSDGSKVGEHFVNLSGKSVKIDSTGKETLIGSGSSIGSKGSNISSSAVNTSKGNVTYTDFAKVPDAPTDENRNTAYPGTLGATYGQVFEDAVRYAQTGKYQKMGMSSKPSAKAYDTAVKTKAANIAASLGMTETELTAAYKANSTAIGKLITMKSTVAAYENKAKAQIDMILNGYKDPVSGKQVPSLNDSVTRDNWQSVNSALVAFKIQKGDTPAKLLSNALITFSNEYAKIMAGSTGSAAGSSDSARQEAASLISTALTNGQLSDTLGLLQKEMDTTIQGYDTQIKETSGSMSVGTKTEQPTVNAPIAKGQMTSNQFVDTVLTNLGMKYDDFIKSVPKGKIAIINNATGETALADNDNEITSDYTRI